MGKQKTSPVNVTSNYRSLIKENNTAVKRVFIAYFLLYAVIGFLYDFFYVLIFSDNPETYGKTIKYTCGKILCGPSALETFEGLLSFKYIPWMTIFFLLAACITILIAKFNFKHILFKGLNAKQLYVGDLKKEEAEGEFNLSDEERQLLNIVQEMRIASVLNYNPSVFIYSDEAPNTFCLTVDDREGFVAVSEGALLLPRDELSAMIAHEFGHLKCEDTKLTYYVDCLSNSLVILLDFFLEYFFFMFDVFRKFQGGKNYGQHAMFIIFFWCLTLVLRLIVPMVTFVLNKFLKEAADYRADALSMKFTRDPFALQKVLKRQYDYCYDVNLSGSPRHHSSFFSGDSKGMFKGETALEKRLKNTKRDEDAPLDFE